MAALSKRQQFILWIVAASLATAALAATLISEHRSAAVRHSLFVVGVPEKGAALFFGDKHCSICHAVNGKGGRVAPDLGNIRLGTPAMGWLTATLWNHAPGMWRQMRGAQSPQLSQEEMAHILAFLYQSGTVDRAGDPAAGERIFSAKGCIQCHAVRSSGGHSGPELSSAGQAGSTAWMHAMWNHAQSMLDPVTSRLGSWPQFTGQEMIDLMAYVSQGGPAHSTGAAVVHGSAERGWQAFQAKCIECHAVRGKGGSIGPELGPDHALPRGSADFAAVLWNHAPAMVGRARQSSVSVPTLQNDELADILQFLLSLRYYEPMGSPFVGERVFAERGCANCHGPKAEGTGQGPKLRSGTEAFTTISLATALWRHGPAMRLRAEAKGLDWPTLQATDVGEIVSFLNDPAREK